MTYIPGRTRLSSRLYPASDHPQWLGDILNRELWRLWKFCHSLWAHQYWLTLWTWETSIRSVSVRQSSKEAHNQCRPSPLIRFHLTVSVFKYFTGRYTAHKAYTKLHSGPIVIVSISSLVKMSTLKIFRIFSKLSQGFWKLFLTCIFQDFPKINDDIADISVLFLRITKWCTRSQIIFSLFENRIRIVSK